jgi:hypothetical protein
MNNVTSEKLNDVVDIVTYSEKEYVAKIAKCCKSLHGCNVSFTPKKGTSFDGGVTQHHVDYVKQNVLCDQIGVDVLKQYNIEGARVWRANWKKTGKMELTFPYEVNIQGQPLTLAQSSTKSAKGKSKKEIDDAIAELQMLSSKM